MKTYHFPWAMRWSARSLLPLVALAVAACSKSELLQVQTPDQITTNNVASASGAQALRISAIGYFARYYAGDIGGGGIGLNLEAAILADEAYTARSGTEHLDSRAQNNAVFPVSGTSWTALGTAFSQNIRAVRYLVQFPPAGTGMATQVGQLYMLRGYLYVTAAEAFCSGIPWSTVNDNNPSSVIMLTADMYTAAQTMFDSALATLSPSAASDASFRYAARIGKARTYVDQNNYVKAAAEVSAGGDGAGSAAVPVSFVLNAEFSGLTTGVVNDAYDWMLATKNFGASDKEGINGLDYVSSQDPRIKVNGAILGPGQDGTLTPLFNQFPNTNSPVALATGIEGQMILAENYLSTGDVADFMKTLNAARATAGIAPLADPGDNTSRVNMLFRERAFWMYFTGHRLGDMRRLVRQYGRGIETVYPTGSYVHGGRYGTDVVLFPQQSETNNPLWQAPAGRTEACADKSP